MSRRPVLESEIQRQILAAIGSEWDYLVLKNSVGVAQHYAADGKSWKVPYGLGVGSPDLVGILAPLGRWLCFEVKCPGEEATKEQEIVHSIWRGFGAFVFVVHSVEETRAALKQMRDMS